MFLTTLASGLEIPLLVGLALLLGTIPLGVTALHLHLDPPGPRR